MTDRWASTDTEDIFAPEPGEAQATSQIVTAAKDEEVDDEEALGALSNAEYVIFLLGYDTFLRYIEEFTDPLGEEQLKEPETAKYIKALEGLAAQGSKLMLRVDREVTANFQRFMAGQLETRAHKTMFTRAMRFRVTSVEGIARRAQMIRDVMELGGAKTRTAVFGKSRKAATWIRKAINATWEDDADKALDVFEAFNLSNARVRAWFDVAAKLAGSHEVPESAIAAGVLEASGRAQELFKAQVEETGASDSGDSRQGGEAKQLVLDQVEQHAATAAKKVMDARGEDDTPPAKSEVVGIATAVATAVVADPANPANVPQSLKDALGKDEEQLAAAMTEGRAIIAAGAGAGKSRTLVARVTHLIKDRPDVSPVNVLVCSFNAEAAEELRGRLRLSVGGDDYKQLERNIGTTHAIFARWLRDDRLNTRHPEFKTAASQGNIADGGSVARTVNDLWRKCKAEFDENGVLRPGKPPAEAPKLKTYWAGNGIDPKEAMLTASNDDEREAAEWYQWYEGLKGAIPGWRFNCQGPDHRKNEEAQTIYQAHEDRARRGGTLRLSDFDDHLLMCARMLEENPDARRKLQRQFKHVLVDECVSGETQVQTQDGPVAVKDLQEGTLILCFNNGSAEYKKVLSLRQSSKTEGIRVILANGLELAMTQCHRLYATPFHRDLIPDGYLALYLMYRKGFGYRVGVSANPFSRGGLGNGRTASERPDALWILETGPSEEMLFKEQSTALNFGVPTSVYEGVPRDLNQRYIDRIFAEFGDNGTKVLEAYGFSPDYPHWVNAGHFRGRVHRHAVMLHAHRGSMPGKGRGCSAIQMSWTGDVPEVLADGVCQTRDGRTNYSYRSSSYSDVRKKAVEIANTLGCFVRETLSVQGESCLKITAANLFPGMKLPVWEGGVRRDSNTLLRGKASRDKVASLGFDVPSRGSLSAADYAHYQEQSEGALLSLDDTRVVLEEIVEVVAEQGSYYDITVEDAGNFFGNRVLSHNCQDLSATQLKVFDLITEHVTTRGENGTSYWMVGDDKQCVADDTWITVTPPGEHRLDGTVKAAKELVPGDGIVSYRNGDVVVQKVRHVEKSSWTKGFKITTASGRSLVMSPNHKIWAHAPSLREGQVAVYLMFRNDMGFRVGITNKCRDDEYLNSFGGRAFMEKAERMWVLDVCDDREFALLKEETYSLQYGIPTMVFEGANRGVNQDRIVKLFEQFGSNGARLLEERHLHFDLPHWMSQSYTKHSRGRRTVHMNAHAGKGTQVSLEWAGDDLDSKVNTPFTVKGERRRLRKFFTNYRAALEFAEGLARRAEANLSRRLSTPEGSVRLTTASGIHVGSQVLISDDQNDVMLDEVVEVETVQEVNFIDIDVDDASNFFGNGILSHNSIYSWRGAKSETFQSRADDENWQLRTITTNYRCPPAIVGFANDLIAHNGADQIPFEAKPNPWKQADEGSLRVETPETEADASNLVVETIKARLADDTEEGHRPPYMEHAVLSRTQKMLDIYETSLVFQGIPFARKGPRSNFGTPEMRGVVGAVKVAFSDDPADTVNGLVDMLIAPNKFAQAVNKPSIMRKKVEAAMRRAYGREWKTVMARDAMQDRTFQNALAQEMGGSRIHQQRVRMAAEDFETLFNIRVGDDGLPPTMTEVMTTILGFRGVSWELDPDKMGQKFEMQDVIRPWREMLSAKQQDRGDDEDESEGEGEGEGEEKESLGPIDFLWQLMTPQPDVDEADEQDPPDRPIGFLRKASNLNEQARKLVYDIGAYKRAVRGLGAYRDRKFGGRTVTKEEQYEADLAKCPPGGMPTPEEIAANPDLLKRPPAVYLGTCHCSPPDEPVLTTQGYVAIGDLDPEQHRVASYLDSCNQLFWGKDPGPVASERKGYAFTKTEWPFQGNLVVLKTGQSITRVTPDHRLRVKFAPEFFDKYVVYLMRRGSWWRVGMTQSGSRPYKATTLETRLAAEKADNGWVLGVFESREAALEQEAILQGRYGILGLTFESSKQRSLTTDQLHRIHDFVSAEAEGRALRLLSDHGLDPEDPLYSRPGDGQRWSDKRESFTIRARNFLSGYMLLPVVKPCFVECTGPREEWAKPQWLLGTTQAIFYDGPVYSLDVDPHHYYVSGGAVVHNSTKGAEWRNTYVLMPKDKFPGRMRLPDDLKARELVPEGNFDRVDEAVKQGLLDEDRARELKAGSMVDPSSPVEMFVSGSISLYVFERWRNHMRDERRLGYVAITRAQERAMVLCPSEVNGQAAGVSPFVTEMGLFPGENIGRSPADDEVDEEIAAEVGSPEGAVELQGDGSPVIQPQHPEVQVAEVAADPTKTDDTWLLDTALVYTIEDVPTLEDATAVENLQKTLNAITGRAREVDPNWQSGSKEELRSAVEATSNLMEAAQAEGNDKYNQALNNLLGVLMGLMFKARVKTKMAKTKRANDGITVTEVISTWLDGDEPLMTSEN